MAGVWSIQPDNLVTLPNIDEYKAFSHSFTYTDDEFPTQKYVVVIVPSETNPETVSISGNNVSGYYSDVFNMYVKYKTKRQVTALYPNEYIEVNNFRKIDVEKLEQLIEYKPDLTPNKTYTYTANVYYQDQIIDSKVFTKIVNNNWDLNKELLLRYISNSAVPDETLFKQWINSINAANVKWKNSSNVVINWI
jgi:hypothetical protein